MTLLDVNQLVGCRYPWLIRHLSDSRPKFGDAAHVDVVDRVTRFVTLLEVNSVFAVASSSDGALWVGAGVGAEGGSGQQHFDVNTL